MIQIIALIIGYIASLLLAIALLVNSHVRFRIINTLGCIAFIIYGILIHAFPVIVTNFILLLINTVTLIKIYSRNENFDIVEFSPDDELIKKFLAFYAADIKAYFPDYKMVKSDSHVSFIVLRDLVIANIFDAYIMEDGTAVIKINYTVPKYRDYKIGKFLFQKEKQLLQSKGIHRLLYTSVFNKQHAQYLLKMGFKKELIDDKVHYYKSIV